MRATERIDSLHPSGDVNVIEGTVARVAQGLVCTAVRVRVGERTALTARWPCSNGERTDFRVGERIRALIPVEAVRLEAGWFRRGPGRWNRWIGRIVLVQGKPPDLRVSVKVYGEAWTLRGRGPVVGAAASPQTWDTVNIVVDPQAVRLTHPLQWVDGSKWKGPAAVGEEEDWQVKLHGRIEGVRSYQGSVLLSLGIGHVKVSALVSDPETAAAWWRPGMPVEIHMGRFEARVNPEGAPDRAVECRLAYHL